MNLIETKEEARKRKDREYHQKHRERDNIAKRKWRENNVRSEQDRHYRRRYGIGFDDYWTMLQAQDSECKICGFMPDNNLVVDHCHTTGRIRGLLCKDCNTGLGMFRDRPDLMRSGADYMEESQTALN
jgi:hypothetical protein